MVGVERFDKSKLQTADQPKQSLAKSKDMTLVGVERFNKDNLRKVSTSVSTGSEFSFTMFSEILKSY